MAEESLPKNWRKVKYINYLKSLGHLAEFIKTFGDVDIYNIQGLEKLNDLTTQELSDVCKYGKKNIFFLKPKWRKW